MSDKKFGPWIKRNVKDYNPLIKQPFKDDSCICWVTYDFNIDAYINGVSGEPFDTNGDGNLPAAPTQTTYSNRDDILAYLKDDGYDSLGLDYQGDSSFTISALLLNTTVDSQYNDEHVYGNIKITNGSGDLLMQYNKNDYLGYKVNDGELTKYNWTDDWLDNWHLITLVAEGDVNNGVFKLYIDGNLISTTDRGSYNSGNKLGLLGVYKTEGYEMSFRGSWADFRIFNRALSPSDINKIKINVNI